MAQLKLIATSDLHGELRDFDYVRGRNDPSFGLSRAAGVIDQLRAEADASLLLDSGDFLFGRPYADLPDGGASAVIEAMDAVGYDAVTIGNHEFDMGADILERALESARMPVISASLERLSNGALLRPATTMIECHLPEGPVRVGVTGVLPQTAFPAPILLKRAGFRLRDPEAALWAAVADLRADGADIVVALCHEGVSRRCGGAYVLPLAAVEGIDAIVLGHLHDVFPGPSGLATEVIDPVRGTIRGIPTVMPGFRGQHVGCIDLTLRREGGAWHVAQSQVDVHQVQYARTHRLRPNAMPVLKASQSAHANALRLSREVVGTCAQPLHTFFSHLGSCRATCLSADAKRIAVRSALIAEGELDAPVIGLAAPILSGGYGGPRDYVDIAPGPVTRGDVQRLAPYADLIVGVRTSGADLKLWLERSASVFERIIPGQHSIRLLDPRFPPTVFDIPVGATFKIDLSQKALFDAVGVRIADGPGRVREVKIDGRPVADDDPVILATTHHRRSGGGRFPIPKGSWIETGLRIDRAIEALLATEPTLNTERTFRFTPLPHAKAVFATSPRATAMLSDMPFEDVTWLDLDKDGFQQVIVRLDGTG